jgi:hypothetical protein
VIAIGQATLADPKPKAKEAHMDATHGNVPQRSESGAFRLALKAVILVAFGAAVFAIARAPVEVGSNALAPTAQAGQADRPAAANAAEGTRYFPRDFPDVRGEIQPTPDTF